MIEHKKLIRAEFEYEDGTITKLVGGDAEAWNKAMLDVMWNYQNHGNKFPNFNWEELKK